MICLTSFLSAVRELEHIMRTRVFYPFYRWTGRSHRAQSVYVFEQATAEKF